MATMNYLKNRVKIKDKRLYGIIVGKLGKKTLVRYGDNVLALFDDEFVYAETV